MSTKQWCQATLLQRTHCHVRGGSEAIELLSLKGKHLIQTTTYMDLELSIGLIGQQQQQHPKRYFGCCNLIGKNMLLLPFPTTPATANIWKLLPMLLVGLSLYSWTSTQNPLLLPPRKSHPVHKRDFKALLHTACLGPRSESGAKDSPAMQRIVCT